MSHDEVTCLFCQRKNDVRLECCDILFGDDVLFTKIVVNGAPQRIACLKKK